MPNTRRRGERNQCVAYYPLAVAREDGAETNQSRALLDEAPSQAPGLDNERVRRSLWRYEILDLTLLGSLRQALCSKAIGWMMVGDDPRVSRSMQAAQAITTIPDPTPVVWSSKGLGLQEGVQWEAIPTRRSMPLKARQFP